MVATSASTTQKEFTGPASRMVIAAVIAQLFGGTMAVGLFPLLMLPMSESFGWSRTIAGSMAAASAAAAAFGMPLWGLLVDGQGARPTLLIGTVLAAAMLLLLSVQSGNLLQSYLSFVLVGLSGAASVANVKALSQQFVARRGLVLAILGVTVGMSFGLAPLVAKPVLEAYGWRAVYRVACLVPFLVSIPLLLAWFHPPGNTIERGPVWRATGWTGLTTPAFWLIVLFAGCSSFIFIGLQAHFIPYLEEQRLSESESVTILSIAVLGSLVCQLATGWLLDRWNSPRAALPFIGIQLLGSLTLAAAATGFAPQAGATMVGTVLLNSGAGGELSMLPYLISRTFGTAAVARLYGVAALSAQLMGAVSSIVMGVIHDKSGHYTAALPLFVVLQVLGGVIIVTRPAFPSDFPNFPPKIRS